MNKAQVDKMQKKELATQLVKVAQDYSALQGRYTKTSKEVANLTAKVKELEKGKDKLHKDLLRAAEVFRAFIEKNGLPVGVSAIFWVISRPVQISKLIKELVHVFKYKQDIEVTK